MILFSQYSIFVDTNVFIQSLRLALSKPSTSIQLCIVGLAAGLVAASVIIVFRLCLELLHYQLLDGWGNYSSLPNWQLFLLPIIAILIVISIAKITGFKHYRLGIPFVIHRFKLHYGHIPLGTSINQFFGGILALASGFVVGKEGPTVHLAAAASHYVGRWFKLPFNSLRIIAGCGIAAGIAAAFNTPFAAVIFVMEVVVRDYKVHVFIPVMLAAACGSVLTRVVFGDVTELSFLVFQNMSYWHFPLLIVLGMFLGSLAAFFNKQLMMIMQLFRPFGMITRLLIAATITGVAGYFMPQSLGAEFANIHTFIESSPQVSSILLLFAAKFILAIVAIALGVPGGIVGAVMVIGILAGLVFLQPLLALSAGLSPESGIADVSMITNYALLGLAGFLAAVLHAPLAALSAAMELSSTQQVILPALITIVSAYVTSKQLCNNRSIFVQQLEYQGLPYTTTAIRDDLQETGVMALMNQRYHVFNNADENQMFTYLKDNPAPVALNYYEQDQLNENDEIEYEKGWYLVNLKMSAEKGAKPVELHKVETLSEQHTLAEVYELLYKQRKGGVVITKSEEIINATQITSEIQSPKAGDNISVEEPVQFSQEKTLHTPQVSGVITWTMLHTYLFRQQH